MMALLSSVHLINSDIREVEILDVYGYVFVWSDIFCFCQWKNINAHGDAGGVGYSDIHYMPI